MEYPENYTCISFYKTWMELQFQTLLEKGCIREQILLLENCFNPFRIEGEDSVTRPLYQFSKIIRDATVGKGGQWGLCHRTVGIFEKCVT